MSKPPIPYLRLLLAAWFATILLLVIAGLLKR